MTPPRLARWLLAIVVPRSDRRFFLGDLDEEFERVAAESGARRASAWYWNQTFGSARAMIAARVRGSLLTARGMQLRPGAAMVDIRQGLRWIARNRSVSVIVVATLAIAFGAVLAGFAVVHAVLVRPLPFPDADRIVNVLVTSPARPGVGGASLQDVDDWRRRSQHFAAMSAYTLTSFRFTGHGEPREIDAERVGPDFDRVLGVRAQHGRLFEPADFVEGSRVAVLTNGFWTRELGADARAIGKTLLLDEQPYRIVGVLPRLDVTFPEPHDLWIPLVARRGAFWESSRGTGWVFPVGRVIDGAAITEAAAELTTIARQLAAEYPESNKDKTIARLTPIAEHLVGNLVPALRLLSIALAAVLLIACGNIATLLLASGSRRQAEFDVRAALGAGRLRIARQLAAESTVLSTIGAAAGTALAPLLVRAFVAVYPTPLPRSVDFVVTPALLGAALLLAAVAAVLVALPQILRTFRSARSDRAAARVTASKTERAAGYMLVTAQVALSLMLVIAGAALVRTMMRLNTVEPGFRATGALSFAVTPSPRRFPTAAASLGFYESALESIRGIPGVRHAAAGVGVPLTTGGWRFGIRPAGATTDVLVAVNLVSTDYFEALGIRLREGRMLTLAEQRTASSVAMVNAELARLLASDGGSFVGKRFDYSERAWEIVGVVESARQRGPRTAPAPELFLPWHMAGKRPQAIVVRSDGDPRLLVAAIAARIRAIDPTAPLNDVQTLDARLGKAVAADRFRMTLLASLAAVGVMLAALGAYSTTAYAVAQRTREYGIRLALGERPASIRRRALWMALAPTLAGIAVGTGASAASARFLEAFLFQVSARDPLTTALAAAVLLATGALAAASSARRAARVDPIVALRAD